MSLSDLKEEASSFKPLSKKTTYFWFMDCDDTPGDHHAACSSSSTAALDLPVEIWESIIEYATEIPGALTLDSYAEIDAFANERNGISVSNHFQATMFTKLALSLTSKWLNAIVQRFIFQYIRIVHPKQVHMALQTLRRFLSKDGMDSPGGPTTWTRRIEVAIVDNVHRHLLTDMLDLFSICKSLTCFSTIFTNGWLKAMPLLHGLGNHKSLKRLEINLDSVPLATIGKALAQKLEVLWICGGTVNHFHCTKEAHISLLVLPSLRVLVSDGHVDHLHTTSNLRACVIEPRLYSLRKGIGLPRRFDRSRVEYLVPMRAVDIVSDLHDWPSLKTLTFDYDSLSRYRELWPPQGYAHPNIECIAVKGLMSRLANRHAVDSWEDGFGTLKDNLFRLISTETFPHLETLKVYLPVQDTVNAQAYLPDESKGVWRSWLRACELQGVCIFVSQGMGEWVADYWMEVEAEELYELLFPELETIERELSGSWSASRIWKRAALSLRHD